MDREKVAGIITKKDIGYRLRKHDPTWRRRPLDSEPVSGVMTKDILSMSPDSSIHDALMFMVTHEISGFPVIDQGMVLGLVTKSDMMKAPIISALDVPVTEVMHDVPTVTSRHTLDHVIDQMKAGCGKVVVTGDDGSLAGLISESDLTFAHEGHDILNKVLAGEIMRSPVVTLPASARTGEVIEEMMIRHISSIVITNELGMKGIITRDDIIGEVVQ
jgi:CBS domain-containing protein